MRKLEKVRKLAFGALGLGVLFVALLVCKPVLPAPAKDAALDPATVTAVTTSVVALFSAFKDGVWLIVGAVIAGNIGEHVAGALKKPDQVQS